MPLFMQPSFAKGEVSPSLYGRVDTAAYQIALKTARNMIVHPYGGASNRPGTLFLGPVKNHAQAPRLVDFQFKTTDTYMLEFGNLYMRVIRNDEYVTDDPINIVDITNADPCVVEATAHGLSSTDEVYIAGVGGMTRLNGRRFNITVLDADTFSLQDQASGDDIDSTGFDAFTSGGTVAAIYEITTPYLYADLMQLKWVQSADVMTLTHNSYPVQELRRTDHDAWTIGEPEFAPDQAYPTAVAVTATTTGSVTQRYQVTAINAETQEESLPGLHGTAMTITDITKADPAVVTSASHGLSNGDEVEINAVVGMVEVNGRRFKAANVATDTFELQGEDSTSYTAYSSGGTAHRTFTRITNGNATKNNAVSWTAAADAGKYAIYFEDNGIFGLVGETETTSFTDDNIEADLAITPPKSRNPFRGTDNYPGAASYFEQRRVFGGSIEKPDTSNYSQTGNQSNFGASQPQQDDDAFSATLAARQVNEIRHYIPGNDLIALTSGSEWRINSGQDSAFAAATIKQKPQSMWGASHNIPIVIGSTVLFVEENQAYIRSLGYSLQIDGYTGTDLTLLADHLFNTETIDDWAFARSPDSTAHIIRSDGQMCNLCFQQEQEVVAWSRWDTKGKFERVGALRTRALDRDDRVYMVVRRRINGNTVRYIERLHSRRFDDVRDCFFVDCGVSYDDPVEITNITSANPVVVTAPAHGFSNGQQVDLSDIVWEPDFDSLDNETQPDQLNYRRYLVANATTDTFSLTNLSGTAIDGSAYNDYVEGGYARLAALTITGLDHLEGEDVSVLADGNVVSNLTVEDGAITLPRRASRVHIGLRYISDLETLDVQQADPRMAGQRKKINSVILRLKKTRGIYIGPDADDLIEFKQRKFEKMGAPTGLLTGDTDPITIPAVWKSNGRVFIRQRYPLPMTLLAVIPDVTTGGIANDD